MNLFSMRILAVVVLFTGATTRAQAQDGPCGSDQLPRAAEEVFTRFFASDDTLMKMARDPRGIAKQSPTAPHGVLLTPNLCARLRTALVDHLGLKGQKNAQLKSGTIRVSMFEFGDYLGAWVHWPPRNGIVIRGRAPLHLFRRSDLQYVADWEM